MWNIHTTKIGSWPHHSLPSAFSIPIQICTYTRRISISWINIAVGANLLQITNTTSSNGIKFNPQNLSETAHEYRSTSKLWQSDSKSVKTKISVPNLLRFCLAFNLELPVYYNSLWFHFISDIIPFFLEPVLAKYREHYLISTLSQASKGYTFLFFKKRHASKRKLNSNHDYWKPAWKDNMIRLTMKKSSS